MSDDIRVHVVKYPDRVNLVMRYTDPQTGKLVARSTRTNRRREAEKRAAKWEAELQEGRYQKPLRITWQGFREAFESSYLEGMKATTAATYQATLNVFERLNSPARLAQVDNAKLTEFVNLLRAEKLSTATIARHLRTLKVALRWAHQQGMLLNIPDIKMPKGAKGMKGRPITLEEFERMLAILPKAVRARPSTDGRHDVELWQFYLRGLWLSGLRLSESLLLRWDEAPGALVVDYSGQHPLLRIPAESEKGNTHRLLPHGARIRIAT